MIRVSSRFAVPLLLLVGAAVALRLTLLRDARGEDRCASPGALKATTLIPGTVALGEKLESLGADTFQWSEGEVANPLSEKLPMRFQIVRSYDATSLYVDPLEYAVDMNAPARLATAISEESEHRLQPEDLRVVGLAAGGATLPIHVAWDHTEAPRGPSRLVAWFFVFDNRPVRSPLASQLVNALSLAANGRRPLTLVTISALASENTAAPVEAAALAWLTRAWEYTARACAAR